MRPSISWYIDRDFFFLLRLLIILFLLEMLRSRKKMSKMKMGALYREEELKNELRPDVMLKPGER